MLAMLKVRFTTHFWLRNINWSLFTWKLFAIGNWTSSSLQLRSIQLLQLWITRQFEINLHDSHGGLCYFHFSKTWKRCSSIWLLFRTWLTCLGLRKVFPYSLSLWTKLTVQIQNELLSTFKSFNSSKLFHCLYSRNSLKLGNLRSQSKGNLNWCSLKNQKSSL